MAKHSDESIDNDELRKRSKRSHKLKSKRTKEKNKRKRRRSSSDEENDEEKRRERKKMKKRSRTNHDDDHQNKKTRQTDEERHYQFANALVNLFDDHPALSTELPFMLIRLASGNSLDLSQMSDATAASGLEQVFQTMTRFGLVHQNKSWTWNSPSTPAGSNTKSELLLLRIARTLLNQVGVTMEAVENFGKKKKKDFSEHFSEDPVTKGTPVTKVIQTETIELLEHFGKKRIDVVPSLADQLGGLCQMVIKGEPIHIDGIQDEQLRLALEKVFLVAGLMDCEGDRNVTGYCLPSDTKHYEIARSNIETVLYTCRQSQIRGPLPASMSTTIPSSAFFGGDDSDVDDGPVPADSQSRRTATMPRETIQAMAVKRKDDLDRLNPNYAQEQESGDRDEWMLHPGEHDFLQGIISTKARSFQNKKVREPQMMDAAPEIMDPKVQAEVDAIYAAHKEARGPSLMDQHRAKVLEEASKKAAKQNKGAYGWNRDKDLDAGRRVDKDALKVILGGGGNELKDKFQGGYGRS